MTKEQLLVIRDREFDEVTRLKGELFTAHAAMEVAQTWGPTKAAGPSPFAAYLADPEREAVAS